MISAKLDTSSTVAHMSVHKGMVRNRASASVIEEIESPPPVLYDTTAGWNSKNQLVAKRGTIYVYSDHMTDKNGNDIPGYKVGDGTSYLIDMPFADTLYAEHIVDNAIHVSPDDRVRWDEQKANTYDVSSDTLIIS